MKYTIESMIAQTNRPLEWVIVNDGSTDGTGEVIDQYARREQWIRPVHRQNRGFRKSGGGVVEAFNDGLRKLTATNWDFIVKLDGDLTFEPNYFETCLREFEHDPTLGIGGGVICYVKDGIKTFEECPSFHVRGATKIYRRGCWEAIGGLWPAPGWDTIDEVKANMLGWTTRSFGALHLIHHRLTGSADGRWGGLIKNGRANYISGYHPLFIMAKCAVWVARKGDIRSSLALLYGFVSGYLKKIPRVNDPVLIAYMRQQQLNRLLGRNTIWK